MKTLNIIIYETRYDRDYLSKLRYSTHSVLEYFTAVIYNIHGQEMNTDAVNILQQQILSTLNIQ